MFFAMTDRQIDKQMDTTNHDLSPTCMRGSHLGEVCAFSAFIQSFLLFVYYIIELRENVHDFVPTQLLFAY